MATKDRIRIRPPDDVALLSSVFGRRGDASGHVKSDELRLGHDGIGD
jgi:hypothetical protein